MWNVHLCQVPPHQECRECCCTSICLFCSSWVFEHWEHILLVSIENNKNNSNSNNNSSSNSNNSSSNNNNNINHNHNHNHNNNNNHHNHNRNHNHNHNSNSDSDSDSDNNQPVVLNPTMALLGMHVIFLGFLVASQESMSFCCSCSRMALLP